MDIIIIIIVFLDLTSWLCDVRLIETLSPLPPDIHADDC